VNKGFAYNCEYNHNKLIYCWILKKNVFTSLRFFANLAFVRKANCTDGDYVYYRVCRCTRDVSTKRKHATSDQKFEVNLKGSPSLFTHAKSAQSVNDDINTHNLTSRHACLEVKFGFKKKIGNLSEGSVPVIFISMVCRCTWCFHKTETSVCRCTWCFHKTESFEWVF
jgi:hypothetical protein